MRELSSACLQPERVEVVPISVGQFLLGESTNPGRPIGKHCLPFMNRQPPAIALSALLP